MRLPLAYEMYQRRMLMRRSGYPACEHVELNGRRRILNVSILFKKMLKALKVTCFLTYS